ncbi:MAG: hypothetical protein QCI38_06175 [Candidatus Thermoplasmatota archaeon]|nr:hypothetical protein [Candidatus Thermoplasmatota archaeon]
MRKHGRKRLERKDVILKCPQCGGKDLYYENAMITGYKYHCKDCDYIGSLVFEERIDKEALNKKEEGENRDANGPGKRKILGRKKKQQK